MIALSRAQEAIRREHIDGWLFFGFFHRDRVADRLLAVSPRAVNTRPWYYVVPADGEPTKVVHAVEAEILSHLPGRTVRYGTREELIAALRPLAGTVAAQYSPNLPVISYLDHGTATLLESLGFRLVSSAALIQRTVGILDDDGIASHCRAAIHLYEIVEETWSRLTSGMSRGETLTEGRVQAWMVEQFRQRELETNHPPIVACGAHAGDPHYAPNDEGSALVPGQVLLLDLWAKESASEAIFADITWTGVLGSRVPPPVQAAFDAVRDARNRGVAYIRDRLAEGEPVEGCAVDVAVREVLTTRGFGEYLRHRTGHGIDTDDHGSGANLDCVEFPDHRLLLEGSCFSVEPGVYLPEFGIRSEIDVYIQNGKPVISGKSPQERLLTF
jgi:Xaa-Pro aminopeptidase